jgi:hypothetical protein
MENKCYLFKFLDNFIEEDYAVILVNDLTKEVIYDGNAEYIPDDLRYCLVNNFDLIQGCEFHFYIDINNKFLK